MLNKRLFILVTLISALSAAAGYLVAPIEARFLNQLTTNTTLVGVVYAVGTVSFALVATWIGRLSDRYGRRNLILFGLLMGIIYAVIYASTYNILVAMGVRVVWAVSGAATAPIIIAYLQDLLVESGSKGKYIGYVFAADSAAGGIAAFGGGYIAEHFGLRVPYLIAGLLFALTFLLAYVGLQKIHKKESVESPARAKVRDFWFAPRYVLSRPHLIYYFVQNTTYALNFSLKYLLWPLAAFALFKSDALNGIIFGMTGVVATIVLLFSGIIADRLGYHRGTLVSFFILSFSGVVLVFTHDLWVFLLAAGFFAVGEAALGPAQGILLTEYVESEYRGEILGFDKFVDTLVQSISLVGAGFVLSFVSPQGVLGFFVSLLLAGFAFLYVYHRRVISRLERV